MPVPNGISHFAEEDDIDYSDIEAKLVTFYIKIPMLNVFDAGTVSRWKKDSTIS